MSNTTPVDPATSSFIERQRTDLMAERARLFSEVSSLDAEIAQLRDTSGPTEVDFSEEGGEGGTLALERDRRLALRGSLSSQLDALDEALVRIANGTYGLCRTCSEPIGEARLEALPAAVECVRCKSASPLGRR